MTSQASNMSDVSIESLRALRSRADQLWMSEITPNLREFKHQDGLTFLRTKSTSVPPVGDVNVTTTCSCVMALALTNRFHEFYDLKLQDGSAHSKTEKILNRLLEAPWMSSGLAMNNAFTTAVVIRTYGLLIHTKLLSPAVAFKKMWDLGKVQNLASLARKLKEQATEGIKFLYRSLSDNTRNLIDHGAIEKLQEPLSRDLLRIEKGWIYESSRFPNAPEEVIKNLTANPVPSTYVQMEHNHRLLASIFPEEFAIPEEQSLNEIAISLSRSADNFKINDYPAAIPVIYWFVDGVSNAKIELPPEHWSNLCQFASREFNRQRSLVLAKHDAKMDPVTMGMAACLCARLRKKATGLPSDTVDILPSMLELVHSIKEVFRYQTKSGIWPKYFPMFHYQEAGSNFCFTFELLEAVLHEFGDTAELFNDNDFIKGLEKAVKWCERSRLPPDGKPIGWNSGGDLKPLQQDQPESWATAVIHMFLCELSNVLSRQIQCRILNSYKADPGIDEPNDRKLNELLDIELFMQGKPESLLGLLKKTMIAANRGRDEAELRRNPIQSPMSALLFGPPGTSKTRLTKSIAEALGWPRIVINPSEFVKESLANVYSRADQIFRDLRDLSAVVVFFDEMDALMQDREATGLDTQTQFLTTSMLPHLTELHDQGRVIFLMATNYQDRFDRALKRAGRFDLLLCMGPPRLIEKTNNLNSFFVKGQLDAQQEKKASDRLLEYARSDAWIKSQLDLFTFADFKEFLNSCGDGQNIGDKLIDLGQSGFRSKVEQYSEYVNLRIKDIPERFAGTVPPWRAIQDLPEEEQKKILKTEVGKYVRDYSQSKRQY